MGGVENRRRAPPAHRMQPEPVAARGRLLVLSSRETYARQFGLSYRLRSAKEIHWRLQRNLLFLQDYLRADPGTISGTTRERLLAYVHAMPGITLADLMSRLRSSPGQTTSIS
jgi:hypothetical protein